MSVCTCERRQEGENGMELVNPLLYSYLFSRSIFNGTLPILLLLLLMMMFSVNFIFIKSKIDQRGIIAPSIVEHTNHVTVAHDEGAVLLAIAQGCPSPEYR